MYQAVAGGYLFRSKVFEVPEAASQPLKLYTVYQAACQNKNTAINFFIDFIYDDVLALSRVD